jgi:hypothetical protein
VITIIPDQPGQGGSLPYIHVNLTGPAGAGWKLQGDSDFTNPPPNYYRGIISGASSVFISFRTVLGWDAPPSTNVIVKSNSTTVVNASYLLPPNLVLAAQPSYSSIGLAGGPFSPLGVCTLSNSGQQNLNWRAEKTASWLSLSALSGTIAPGQGISINLSVDASANSLAAGTYSDEVHFYNNSTSLGDTKQSVNLTVVTIKLGGFRFLNRSNIIMTLEGLPGKTYSIQRAVNVSQFTSNWTDLMFITNTTGAVTFTTAYPTNFPKAFYRARQL